MKNLIQNSFLIIFFLLLISFQSSNEETDPIAAAETLIGLEFTQAERDSLRDGLEDLKESYRAMREYPLANSNMPAILFNPIPPGFIIPDKQEKIDWKFNDAEIPDNKNDLAFYTVAQLSELIKTKKISSLELTTFFLNRLKKYGDTLQCVITLTEDLALNLARKADQEIASGKYKGPLHGIPYGVKDLLAVKGYKTTWGARPYEEQILDETSTVVAKLTESGAVLIAKLSMGALAWGDVWFGGVTRNPWNLNQGSSGSSAGSASATAAGLVPFAIGTETWGSIVSPSTRCGTTGLRPTYGRVSRYGAMALSWSMDKIGPICRTAEDCAIVFQAIQGTDGIDPTLYTSVFNYKQNVDLSKLKIGYFKDLFDRDYNSKSADSMSLEVLKKLGAKLIATKMPEGIPISSLGIILNAEAAAAFDELTRSNRDSLLVRQIKNAWPNSFRRSRFIPAVEYIQANRIRTDLIAAMHKLMSGFDVIVTPSFGGPQLLATNLTGHPVVVLPNGFNERGSPVSISFLGNLFDEATILAVAKAYQEATDFDEKHPEMFMK
jgi:Asp-tRNA(Asn)/Glu-tRNA(Gln) amidotransferase A subunit family amidase